MDEMLSDAALPRAIELYCGAESSEKERVEGLNTVMLQVHRGHVRGLNDLVAGHLRPYLTNEEGFVRMRGTKLLAQLLQRLPDMKLERSTVLALVRFFVERFKTDYESAGPCLAAIKTLLEIHEASIDAAELIPQLVSTVLSAHHVPAMTQSLRMGVYQVVQVLTERQSYAGVLRDSFEGYELVERYTESMDGEKDPRCLLVCLRVGAALLRLGLTFGSEDLEDQAIEKLFDVTCVYFPIVFRPPSNDPYNIRAEDLWSALHQVFKCHPLMAGPVIGLLTDKLTLTSADVSSVKLDSLRTLQVCLPAYGCGAIAPFLGDLGQVLLRLVVNADDAAVAEEAAAAVGVVTEMLSKQEEALQSLESGAAMSASWQQFVGALVSECCTAVNGSPDSMVGHASARVLIAIAQGASMGLAAVTTAVVPLLERWCVRPDATETQRSAAFDLLAGVVRGIDPHLEFQPGNEPITAAQVGTVFRLLCDEVSKGLVLSVTGVGADEGTPAVAAAATTAPVPSSPGSRPRSASQSELGTKRAAIEALEELITRPPRRLVNDAQVRQAVESMSRLLAPGAAENEAEARSSCLKAMVAIGKLDDACADIVSSVAVPIVSSSLENLEALADVCAVPAVFDAVVPRLLAAPRVADGALLSCLAKVVEANRGYEAGLEKCCLPLSDGDLLLPRLLHGAKAGTFEVGPRGEHVIRVVAQSVTGQVQKELCVFAVAELLGQATVSGSSAAAAMAIIGSARPEVVDGPEAGIDLEAVTRTALALALAPAEDGMGAEELRKRRESAWACVASLLNKADASAHEALFQEVQTQILRGCSATDASADARDANLVGLVWVAKALAMRAHANVGALCELAVSLMQTAEKSVAMRAGELFGAVIKSNDAVLCKASHARENLFYRQRFFQTNFGRLKAMHADAAPGSASRKVLLLAVARLLEHVPKALLLGDVTSVLPLLTQALSSDDESTKTSALPSLAAVVESNLDATEPFLLTLVPVLLELTKYRPGLSARHRALAIDCLLAFASLPYNKIHLVRAKVTRQLQTALDDPKRPVRRRAVECRNRWLVLQNV